MTNTPFQFCPTMRRVEKAAWNTIRRCCKAKGITSLPLPVPLELWIEGPLGITLRIADLSSLSQPVLGMANPRERAIVVSHTLTNNDGRYRFTLAHELGHIILHAKVDKTFPDLDDADFMVSKFEREADRFAAAYLMPIPVFSTEYANLAAPCWGEPVTLLEAVGRGEASASTVFRNQILPALSSRFGTSLSATVRRFTDVRLADGQPALTYESAKVFLPQSRQSPSLWHH